MIDYLAPKKVLTPAEYFSKFVNFYGESLGAASGVQTTVDSPTDTTTPGEVPSIYDDQGGEGSDRAEDARVKIDRMLKDPSEGLRFFDKPENVYSTRESYDFAEAFGFGGDMVNADSFFGSMVDTPYGTQQSFQASGAFGLGLGLLMGAPVPLGAIHALNMQGAAITAGKVKASNFTGGALMEINNAKVYRNPGSFQYNGNTQGMNNAQLKAFEGFQRHGYVGDWTETQNFAPEQQFSPNQPLSSSVATGTYSHSGTVGYIYGNVGRDAALASGGDYDPVTGKFGFVGANGWQGAAMGTKQAAQKITRALEAKYGLSKDSFSYTNVAKARGISRATGQRFDNVLDGLARQQSGSTISSRPNFGPDFFSKERRAERASKTAAVEAEKERAARAAEAFRAAEAQRAASQGFRGGGGGDASRESRSSDRGFESAMSGGAGDTDFAAFRSGGRVGMQAGGEAGFAQRPEFVGGNETPTDRQSIADDKPREVPEGTFVINAAAADFAGREDIEKMIREAYTKAGDLGQTGVSQEIDIAVSEGEVIIPPHIAKIIGYDRLNKINTRGKKEISRRQAEREKKEAAGGGFISSKKFHKGGDVAHVHIYGNVDKPAVGQTSEYGEKQDDLDYRFKREEQEARKSKTPSLKSDKEKKAYRKGVEFGDIEVYADILGKTNFNKLIQEAARDTRTLSDYVTTLREGEEIVFPFPSMRPMGLSYGELTRKEDLAEGTYDPFDPKDKYITTDGGVIIKSPSFFSNPDSQSGSNVKGYTAVLAHELMHKGASMLLTNPNFEPSNKLKALQRLYADIPDTTDDYFKKTDKGAAEHRYIAAVIGQAYLERDMESLKGQLENFKRIGRPITDYEFDIETRTGGRYFRTVTESDIITEKSYGILDEIQRVYSLYLSDINRKEFLAENSDLLEGAGGSRNLPSSYVGLRNPSAIDNGEVSYEQIANAYSSINRIMAEDYLAKIFEGAVVDKPVDIPRTEKQPVPKVDLPPEPVYERGFLDKMLGVTPAY